MDPRTQPGFRRHILLLPEAGQVIAAVEDDYHAMAVRVRHDGRTITAIATALERLPWTTCPGAGDALRQMFSGVRLDSLRQADDKRRHCTHLHDLLLLAAAHAADHVAADWRIAVADPHPDGRVDALITRDGQPLLALAHREGRMLAPDAVAGASLYQLRTWIDSLDPATGEAARLLQWGTILAHGRTRPIAEQSDASTIPPNCFTFQPGTRETATRVGTVRNFAPSGAGRLADDGPDARRAIGLLA